MAPLTKVREISHHIRQANRVSFIIGAGASKAARIPMARDLMAQVAKKYSHCVEGLEPEERNDYGRVMARLTPQERKDFIEPLLRDSGISWGQIALASLIAHGYVSRVLTFNFDLVLERAASLLGKHLPVYDFGVSPTRDIQKLAEPAIVHLHGQSYGLVLLNTDAETRAHRENISPLLTDTVQNHVTIVAGYSGEADPAFEIIQEQFNSYSRLIWLGFSRDPAPHLNDLFKKDYAEYVGDCDFERTMIGIAKQLEIWPPKIIANPPSHLLAELQEVVEYPAVPDDDHDALTSTRKRLQDYSDRWVEESTAEDRILSSLVSGDQSNEADDVDGLSDHAKRARALSIAAEGDQLFEQSKTQRIAAQRETLNAALEKFRATLKLDPKNHHATYQIGFVLLNLGKISPPEIAQSILDDARQSFLAATELRPVHAYSWLGAATALFEGRGYMNKKDRKAALDKALELDAKARELSPRDVSIISSIGITTIELARIEPSARRADLFAQAEAALKETLEKNRQYASAWSGLGYLNALRACTNTGQARKALVQEAEAAFANIKDPDGPALFAHARARAICSDYDGALDLLKTYVNTIGQRHWQFIAKHPDFASMAGLPGFVDVIKALKAADQASE